MNDYNTKINGINGVNGIKNGHDKEKNKVQNVDTKFRTLKLDQNQNNVNNYNLNGHNPYNLNSFKNIDTKNISIYNS